MEIRRPKSIQVAPANVRFWREATCSWPRGQPILPQAPLTIVVQVAVVRLLGQAYGLFHAHRAGMLGQGSRDGSNC